MSNNYSLISLLSLYIVIFSAVVTLGNDNV